MKLTRNHHCHSSSSRPASPKSLIGLILLPLLLSLLLALPVTRAQSTLNEPLLLDTTFSEFSTTIKDPVLTIDPDLLGTFEPLDTTQPAETDNTTTDNTGTFDPSAPTGENTTTENQDSYTRPPADETGIVEPAETTDTPSLLVPGTNAPADSTPERTTPDDSSTRLPTGTFTPRLPGLTTDPNSPETPPLPDCPPADTPDDASIGNDSDVPSPPCVPAAPIIPVAHPLLFVTPFLGLLLFWAVLSYLNGRHGARSEALRQRHLRNRHLGTVDHARRQTCNELLDFLASSTDPARPLNHQALEQFLARLALLGSPETNQIAEKIRTAFLKDDRRALKPLIGEITASIRRDLQ